MFGQIDWMEIAKLSVGALTPMMTAFGWNQARRQGA
jgi:hypothetical protein